jgi:hypothetical protein
MSTMMTMTTTVPIPIYMVGSLPLSGQCSVLLPVQGEAN